MSLTVPRAGSVAGRSANVVAAPNQTGQMVAEFANRLTGIGIALEDDRLSRQANRLQVDMMRDFNNLALELQSIGDPDVLDQTWTERSNQLRQAYTSASGEDGRPRVDPRNLERFTLAFDEMASRSALSIGARALELRQSQRRATFDQFATETVNAASTVDPDTAAWLIEGADMQIAEMEATGTITPEEAQRFRTDIRANTANARAITMIGADPQGFLAAADRGEFVGLGAETVARYSVQAQSAIDAATTRAQTEAQRLADERARQVTQELNDAAAMALDGRSIIDEHKFSQADYQNSEAYPRYQAAAALRAEQPLLSTMTVSNLRTLVAQERQRPITAPYEQARLDLLEEQLAKAEAGWSADPVAHAAGVGLNVPPRPEFDPSQPQTFATFLAERRAMGEALVQDGYIRTPRVLSEEDRAYVRQVTDLNQDPAARAAAAAVLVTGLPAQGPDSAAALIDDPVFLHVGALLATGVQQSVATEVFRGQQEIEAGNVILPSNATRIGAAGETLQEIFGDIAGGATEQARVRAATDALYAARARRTDPANADDIDEDLYMQALFEVMGGSGAYDSRDALGGVKELNGYQTVLPRGVSGAMAESAISQIGYDAAGAWTPATMAAQLSAASLTGAAPALVTEDRFWDDLQDARFQAVGNDQYIIVFNTASGVRSLRDTNGQEYRLSLSRLISQVAP
jgi:hypothetical protein